MEYKTIRISEAYTNLVAYSLLKLAEEHKKHCEGPTCTVTLFPLRRIVSQLLDRPLTDAEIKTLS